MNSNPNQYLGFVPSAFSENAKVRIKIIHCIHEIPGISESYYQLLVLIYMKRWLFEKWHLFTNSLFVFWMVFHLIYPKNLNISLLPFSWNCLIHLFNVQIGPLKDSNSMRVYVSFPIEISVPILKHRGGLKQKNHLVSLLWK